MTNLDMSTKEHIRTYYFDNFNTNRNAQRKSVIKGRTVIELGTRQATTYVGNLYRVFDYSVKSFKYLLLVGVANQNPIYGVPVDKEDVEIEAAINALVNPIMEYIVEEPFDDDYFMDLCIVMNEITPVKFIYTAEESGLTMI